MPANERVDLDLAVEVAELRADQDARQALSLRAKDSAGSEAVVNVSPGSSAARCIGARCCWALHHKSGELGDQSTPFQWRLWLSGRCWRSKRLETPLRLFTSEETASFGGYSTSRCTRSPSPSISTSVARVGAYVGEDCAQDVDSQSVEHTAAIFCYEDQLHALVENAVPASAVIAFVAHKPTVSWGGETLTRLQIRASSQ